MKKTLAAALAALLAAAAFSGCGRETPPAAPATLAVASDLHYVGEAIEDGGELFTRVVEEGDGRQLDYIRPITDAFLAEVAEDKPDALILTGDLTFNGEKASHQELAAKLNELVEAGVPPQAARDRAIAAAMTRAINFFMLDSPFLFSAGGMPRRGCGPTGQPIFVCRAFHQPGRAIQVYCHRARFSMISGQKGQLQKVTSAAKNRVFPRRQAVFTPGWPGRTRWAAAGPGSSPDSPPRFWPG